MSKLTRFVRWLVVLAVPSTALGLLVQTPVGLDSLSTPEQTLLAVAWWLGIGLSGWLILSQFLFTAATLAGAGSLTARLAPFTLPIARRAAAGLASASITLATVGTPALAQAPNTGETIQIAEEYGLRAESTPTPQLQPLVEIETRPLSVLDSERLLCRSPRLAGASRRPPVEDRRRTPADRSRPHPHRRRTCPLLGCTGERIHVRDPLGRPRPHLPWRADPTTPDPGRRSQALTELIDYDRWYPDVPPVMDTKQLAELLNTSDQIIRQWTRAGLIPAHRSRPGGRKLSYLRHEIFQWLEDNRYDASAEDDAR